MEAQEGYMTVHHEARQLRSAEPGVVKLLYIKYKDLWAMDIFKSVSSMREKGSWH
jgi:hypothetical protein